MGTTDRRAALARNLARVRERIAAAAERAGRDSAEVTLVAVTKTVSADLARAIVELGVRDIGENRVQQLLEKQDALSGLPVRFHLVGHLQTNKVRKVVGRVALLHSLDRLALVDELERRLAATDATMDTLLEVNVSGEPSKFGFSEGEVVAAAERVLGSPRLRLRGLMAMAPFVPAAATRPYFARAKRLFDTLRERYGASGIDTLSLGMSNDFEVAIEEGSTMVRIGTALFEGVR